MKKISLFSLCLICAVVLLAFFLTGASRAETEASDELLLIEAQENLGPGAASVQATCTHPAFSQIYSEATHPHEYFKFCTSCWQKFYTGGHATKNHGDGTWGSGTCPQCGTHSFTWDDCTGPGRCACGLIVPALGHLRGGDYNELAHPHYNYTYCARSGCNAMWYTGGTSTRPHGSSGSGYCPECGDHTFYYATDPDSNYTLHTMKCDCLTYVLDWNLINYDNQLHIYSNSKYAYHVTNAIAIWNSYKSGTIIKETSTLPSYVVISDTDEQVSYIGITLFSSKQILLSTLCLDGLSSEGSFTTNEIIHTIAHEIGHALGLAHNPNGTNNIMYAYKGSCVTPSAADKRAFDYIQDEVTG